MAKKKTVSVECDSCGIFKISFSGKKSVEVCPFCSDPVETHDDEHPLLNSLEALDNIRDYEDEDDEED